MPRKMSLLTYHSVTVSRPNPVHIKITTRSPAGTTSKDIVLGEEHPEMTPTGEWCKGVTVQEGDSGLITRTKSPTGTMEIRREFTKSKMIVVSIFAPGPWPAIQLIERLM